MTESLHEAVTNEYYKTTAARGHVGHREHYEFAANGLHQRLAPWLPTDKAARCLDIACGCGEVVYALERAGFSNTGGVDLCKEEVEKGRDFVRAELHHADVLSYLRGCAPASLDFITALNFLEHLPKDALYQVLGECRRVLSPSGTLVALVPNALSPFSGVTRYWDITHEWAFTPNNFRQLSALIGFEKAEFRECGPVPHGAVSTVRFVLWQAVRAAIAARLLIEVADTKDYVYTMDMMVRLHAPAG
jgi:SAM-dependent methyltransferase